MIAIYNSSFSYTMKTIENKINDNSITLNSEENRLNINVNNSIENEETIFHIGLFLYLYEHSCPDTKPELSSYPTKPD